MHTSPPSISPAVAAALKTSTPQLWLNPELGKAQHPATSGVRSRDPALGDIETARNRFHRARGLLNHLFPAMRDTGGVVDSPLLPVTGLQRVLGTDPARAGTIFLKADHLLPVAGSIKARGGFHEVIAHAESLAIEHGLLAAGSDLETLAGPPARALFEQRTIAVGSTGNLGLSIGILSAALGFTAVVHMSHDAKPWKKAALRQRGVRVVEHQGDYAAAVQAGRAESHADRFSYFVDDENSPLLFLGYAAAARQLIDQLQSGGRPVSQAQPLFVYLPCGVGGAPGGITFGLKQLLGDNVHCFFAEPVASPCMLAQLACGFQRPVSVHEFGLSNRTQADGLAVPQASPLVAALMASRVSGVFTVTDEQLFAGLLHAWKSERLALEPSATAGFPGPRWLLDSEAGQRYVATHRLESRLANATHVVWSTGGGLLPTEEHERFRQLARQYEAG